jgi:hypothetical protein
MYALRLLLYAVSFVRPVDESLLLGNDKLATHTNNYFIFAKIHPTCLGIFLHVPVSRVKKMTCDKFATSMERK